MPTTHVCPESGEQLQDIANALLKARKVVVVTGAGISTNSGIPDFRSENGLYSLIQAQFDAAARQSRQNELAAAGAANNDNEDDAQDDAGRDEGPRASKRRRISREQTADADNGTEEDNEQVKLDLDAFEPTNNGLRSPGSSTQDEDQQQQQQQPELPDAPRVTLGTPELLRRARPAANPATSPLSSPPPDDLIVLPSTLRTHRDRVAIPLSSSPLSSPPPVLFDPFPPSSPSEQSSSCNTSTSPSDVDDSPSTNPASSSQASIASKNMLPNMKGKDLFDASIWADPLRTSVFYTFATTLRQKVKDISPTTSHRFISHLRDRGKLVRCYTQNIDRIEEKVGLSTSLQDGPGSRGRFSRRSTATMDKLNQMVDEAPASTPPDSSGPEKAEKTEKTEKTEAPSEDPSQQSQASQSDGTETPKTESQSSQPEPAKCPPKNPRREPPRSGVECVFLHGSLEQLRCFLCARVCSWDHENRELETMSGQQPECPHCVGATTAREERGKRALGVGKLRPDIVLYGEEHPSSHLISPIVTHDLALTPDLLLILGTSLRVHGLKVMVREFAKAVHTKGGKVVFVNFTKPPESSWGDVIDYWVQWDCDAWVGDLQERIPKLWLPPDPPKPRKKRESSGVGEDGEKEDIKKPPPAYPVALRDTKITGAYWTSKIMNELHRITGQPVPDRRASLPMAATTSAAKAEITVSTMTETATETTTSSKTVVATSTTDVPSNAPVPIPKEKPAKVRKPRARKPRRSAPAALEKAAEKPTTTSAPEPDPQAPAPPATPVSKAKTAVTPAAQAPGSSILESVKSKPRVRKRKKIDGEEVVMPMVGQRRAAAPKEDKTATPPPPTVAKTDLKLPPLQPQPPADNGSPYGRPVPMEPKSPPPGPLASISGNLRAAMTFHQTNAFFLADPLHLQFGASPVRWESTATATATATTMRNISATEVKVPTRANEADAVLALTSLSGGMGGSSRGVRAGSEMVGKLMQWGGRWEHRQ